MENNSLSDVQTIINFIQPEFQKLQICFSNLEKSMNERFESQKINFDLRLKLMDERITSIQTDAQGKEERLKDLELEKGKKWEKVVSGIIGWVVPAAILGIAYYLQHQTK